MVYTRLGFFSLESQKGFFMSVVIDLFTYYITSNISAVITRLSWSYLALFCRMRKKVLLYRMMAGTDNPALWFQRAIMSQLDIPTLSFQCAAMSRLDNPMHWLLWAEVSKKYWGIKFNESRITYDSLCSFLSAGILDIVMYIHIQSLIWPNSKRNWRNNSPTFICCIGNL